MFLAVSVGDSVQKALDQLGDIVPKIVFALIILAVGFFIARIIRKVVHRLLSKLNFDQAMDKAGFGTYIERAGFADSGALLAKLVYYFVALIVLQLAISVFGDTPVSEIFNDLLAFLPRLLVAVIIIILTGVVANVVKDLTRPAVAHLSFADSAVAGVGMLIWFIGGFAALDHLQVAEDIIDTLFQYSVGAIFLIAVIKFGVGGIWSARDRFWPAVYEKVGNETSKSQ